MANLLKGYFQNFERLETSFAFLVNNLADTDAEELSEKDRKEQDEEEKSQRPRRERKRNRRPRGVRAGERAAAGTGSLRVDGRCTGRLAVMEATELWKAAECAVDMECRTSSLSCERREASAMDVRG